MATGVLMSLLRGCYVMHGGVTARALPTAATAAAASCCSAWLSYPVRTFAAPASSARPLRKPASAGARGGSKPQPAAADPKARIYVNDDIRKLGYSQVRLVGLPPAAGSSSATSKVLSVPAALEVARGQGRDLVLLHASKAGDTSLPVVGLRDARAHMASMRAAAKKSQSLEREQARAGKGKELRFTARISEHDLSVKAGKMIDFLRSGLAVRVSVAFSAPAAASREEAQRRTVLARVVSQVVASGVGSPDVASLRAEGGNLNARFNPIRAATARTTADAERAMQILASPMRGGAPPSPAVAPPQSPVPPVAAPPTAVATSAAPPSATAASARPSVKLEEVLPSPQALARMRARPRGVKAGLDADAEPDGEPEADADDDDVARARLAPSLTDALPARPRAGLVGKGRKKLGRK